MSAPGRSRLAHGYLIAALTLLACSQAIGEQPAAAVGQARLVDIGGHRLEALVVGEGTPRAGARSVVRNAE